MKRPLIISSIVLCSLYVLLSSNAAGPASSGNGLRNGAPGSNGNCSACHGGGAGTTTASISLKEKVSGTVVTNSYKPGMVYTVTISGNNPNLAFFGFQVTAVKGAAQAGAFSNLGADKHIANLSGLQVVEHSTSLAKVNNQYEASFDWTAPAAGTGNIIFNGIINGVNKDVSTTGDKSSGVVTLSLTEQGNTSISELSQWAELTIYPNPAAEILRISADRAATGFYSLQVSDLNGKVIWKGNETVAQSKLQVEVPLHNLAQGVYFLSIKGKEQSAVRMFSKK